MTAPAARRVTAHPDITLPDPADLAAVPVAELPAVIAHLAALQAAAAMRLRTAPSAPAADVPGEPDALLAAADVAALLGVPEGAARDLMRRGELPVVLVGKKYKRVRRADVLAYIATQTEPGVDRRPLRRVRGA